MKHLFVKCLWKIYLRLNEIMDIAFITVNGYFSDSVCGNQCYETQNKIILLNETKNPVLIAKYFNNNCPCAVNETLVFTFNLNLFS